MADLVNDTARKQLSPRNQEPTHLKGGSYEVLGGPGVASEPNGPDYKIDAAKGIGTDTTIPKSVGAEKSHLKTEGEDDLDIAFDDDDLKETDDLDKELDAFESVEPASVSIDLENPDKEQHGQKNESEDDDEKEVAESEDDEKKDNPFAESEEDDEKKEVAEDEKCDDDKKSFGESEDEDEKKEVAEEEDEDEVKAEAVKIRIKMPDAKLYESAKLSKEAQKRVGVIFEQAIKQTTTQVAKQLHEHYKKLHETKLAKHNALMAKQLDNYLSYVTEEWVKANQVAVRQSLRAQLAEEFLDGLQKLFKEHYIDVPESRVDVVKQLTSQVNKLKKSINEQHAQKLKLRRLAESANKARIVAEFARSMSEAQAAKLQRLAEDVSYSTAKDFREKLTMLKESYFPAEKKPLKRLPEETVQESADEKKQDGYVDPIAKAIADTLSRQADQSKW